MMTIYRLTHIITTLAIEFVRLHPRLTGGLVAVALAVGAFASVTHINIFTDPAHMFSGHQPSGEPVPAVLARSMTCFVPSGSGIAEIAVNPEGGCPANGTVGTNTSKWTCPDGMFTDGRDNFGDAPSCWVDGETCVGNGASFNESPKPFTGRRGLNMFGMAACLKSGYEPVNP